MRSMLKKKILSSISGFIEKKVLSEWAVNHTRNMIVIFFSLTIKKEKIKLYIAPLKFVIILILRCDF